MNERVTELRKRLSLSMEEFGKKLGVTRSSISNIESGRRGLTDQMILSMCREFNVNEEWLRLGTGNMFQPETKDEIENLVRKYGLNQLEYIFLEHYLNLEDSARENVFNFIIDVFSDFNESPVSLSAPAKIFKRENLPDAMFEEAPAKGNDLFEDIPDTPEELEKKYPPVGEDKREGGLG